MTANAIGWRGEIKGKRGKGTSVQVKVFGAWFELHDRERILPIMQDDESEGEEEEEDDEGEEEEEEEVEVDSSGDERPKRKVKRIASDSDS